jgi:putative PIN family toxin of toxin-antitoxin system
MTTVKRVSRLIPDANILLRGIAGRGLAKELYASFTRAKVHFVVSAELMAELNRVLTYPRVLKLGLGITPSMAFSLALELMYISEFFSTAPKYEWPSLSDVKDWYLLDLLFESAADGLVTEDKQLLKAGKKLGMPVYSLQ